FRVEERRLYPFPAGRAGDRNVQQDTDHGRGEGCDQHGADRLPSPVGDPLQLDVARSVEPCGHVSSGAPPVPASQVFSRTARVPSWRSWSTARLTHRVSGEPLSSTMPNCSGTPTCGSWPTILPPSSSAAVM